mmetsp:Transcript_106087/g.330904  ORF Transcript_106087/g.330904 Transcript_106087/m.330904 type:complete len:233 (+) Transcript_106087:867-1565(+)
MLQQLPAELEEADHEVDILARPVDVCLALQHEVRLDPSKLCIGHDGLVQLGWEHLHQTELWVQLAEHETVRQGNASDHCEVHLRKLAQPRAPGVDGHLVAAELELGAGRVGADGPQRWLLHDSQEVDIARRLVRKDSRPVDVQREAFAPIPLHPRGDVRIVRLWHLQAGYAPLGLNHDNLQSPEGVADAETVHLHLVSCQNSAISCRAEVYKDVVAGNPGDGAINLGPYLHA